MSNESVEVNGVRIGFRDAIGQLYLLRCPECRMENYILAVCHGECAWCGWKEKRDIPSVEDDTL